MVEEQKASEVAMLWVWMQQCSCRRNYLIGCILPNLLPELFDLRSKLPAVERRINGGEKNKAISFVRL
jgi:hypothetical protein